MNLDLEALETSFDLVAPRGDELMDVFYARLFAAAPEVAPLFAATDLARQKAMLLGTLVLLRNGTLSGVHFHDDSRSLCFHFATSSHEAKVDTATKTRSSSFEGVFSSCGGRGTFTDCQ